MTDRIVLARSTPVTFLAWILMGAGALLTPVSLISLLMIVTGGDGTQSATLLGGVRVIVLPPATAVAGFGLWRRWRWAYAYVLLLLGGIAAWNAELMLRGPTAPRTVLSADGVPTHVSGSEVDYPLRTAATVAALGMLAALLTRRVRGEFAAPARSLPAPSARRDAPRVRQSARGAERSREARGWRVGHTGRDEMYYEELRDGRCQRIRIGGEMLTGRAHHVIWFASPREWQEYPAWARERRDEIVARIKSEFAPPDYEYHGDGPGTATASGVEPDPASPPAARSRASAGSASRGQWRALAFAATLLLGISAGTAGLAAHGVASGATWLPMPNAAHRRVVARADEPAAFWLSIGLYAAVAAGAIAATGWLAREGLFLRRSSPRVR